MELIFKQEDADRIFEELKDLQVDLDADPLSFGPKRMNAKVAEVRQMLSRAERIFLDISQHLHTVKRDLKIATLELALAKQHLFANDPETRAGRSVADREAIASGKLSDKIQQVHLLELANQDLDSVLLVIKAKRTDLKDTEGRLRDQVRLCQEELGLGARWGSRHIPDVTLVPGLAKASDMDEFNGILKDIGQELHLKEPAEVDSENEQEESEESEESEAIADILPATATHEETDGFLEDVIVDPPKKTPLSEITEAIKQTEDQSIEDLLKSFESKE